MAGAWLSEAIPEVERSDRQRMVRHGLRGLLKKADPGALALMGYDPESPVTLTDLHGAPAVTLGERLAWGFALSNPTAEDALIRVDYVLHRPLAALVRSLAWHQLMGGGRLATRCFLCSFQ